MSNHEEKKVVKYHKPLQFNMGFLVFALILVYLIYNLFLYFTTNHTSVYEVSYGTIAQDTHYTGLILREESVYKTECDGYVIYTQKDGSKVGIGDAIYSVDETGTSYEQIQATGNSILQLDTSLRDDLFSITDAYRNTYSTQDFNAIYDYKEDIEMAVMESVQEYAPQVLAQTNNGNLKTHRASETGLVVFRTDGLEDVTIDSLTTDMLLENNYPQTNHLQQPKVVPGDSVYKMITSEHWYIVIPISDDLARELADDSYVEIRFKEDNTTAYGASNVISVDGTPCLSLWFQNSMYRYALDRYIDIELLISDTSGLKIPNSSITAKQFLTIPKDYITKGGDSNKDGVLIQHTDEEGNTSIVFTPATLFYETDTSYYIDADDLSYGDVVIKPDSMEKYILSETATLEGVYNINKGYAVFRRIEKLFENEEYTIVKSGTSYGISLYDHIALDGQTIHEDDIVH